MEDKMKDYDYIFQNKYQKNIYPRKFKWQQSFQDHIIRNKTDLTNHINYIKINPYKHKIINKKQKYKWIYINKNIC